MMQFFYGIMICTGVMCMGALQADNFQGQSGQYGMSNQPYNYQPNALCPCGCGCQAPCHCGCTEGQPCTCHNKR